MSGILKLDMINIPLLHAGVYESSNFRINTIDGIDRFTGIVRADVLFSVKILQSNDGVNWDHEAVFKSERSGNEYQCAVHLSRFGIYAKWQVINGTADMTFLRGQINGVS